MIESSEWSGFNVDFGKATPSTKDVGSDAKELATELQEVTQQLEILAARKEQIEDEIARWFPEVEGKHEKHFDGLTIEVSRTSRWLWDKDVLSDLFDNKPLPTHITRRLSVDKRKFQKLTKSEQDELIPALTKKLDKAKVKVINNV